MTTPPVPAQRKVKLVTALKNIQSEQSSRLQTKNQFEHDLLEDVRSYAKIRAGAEKDYAQAILKMTSQMLSKFQNKEVEQEEARTPYVLWRKILEETESMANSRLQISQTLHSDVADSIKNLKTERVATIKKCSTLVEKLHEEIQVSAAELSKAQKAYSDLQKITQQARESATDAQERLRKGTVGLFSSKAKMEKNLSKANERLEVSERRSTVARNEYLLTLASLNGHQRKYYSLDLPDLLAMQDGSVYEDFRKYFTVITNTEKKACQKCLDNLSALENDVGQLQRALAIQCFLKENPIFTQCTPHEFAPLPGDSVTNISEEFGAGLPLNKEARKWTLRLAREQKNRRKKVNELERLQASTSTDSNSTTEPGASSDGAKTTEQSVEGLAEEIRHLEVLQAKAEARVEALREAGVNVDEWLQGALAEQENEEDDVTRSENDEMEDEDDFGEDEWDDPSPRSNALAYSDDALSTTSSVDPKCFTTPAIALYSFQASSQEELSITDGEELVFIEREGDGWCKTRNKAGQVGYVPEAYIEVRTRRGTNMSDDGFSASRASSFSGSVNMTELYQEITASGNASQQMAETDRIEPVCFAKAIYDYEGCEEEELSFNEGDVIMVVNQMVDDDDGWWEGILNGKRGVFPSLVVEETKAPVASQDFPVMSSHSQSSDQYATFPRAKGTDDNNRASFYLDNKLNET